MLFRRLLFIAAFVLAETMLLSAAAQAACDGGACPILRGGQRTQAAKGLPFPIAAVPLGPGGGALGPVGNTGVISSMRIANPQPAGPLFPGGPPKTGTPAHGRLLTNPAAGAVRPFPGAKVTVFGAAHPRGIVVPHGQLTWGCNGNDSLTGCAATGGAPPLNVMIFNINPMLFSITTMLANQWPRGNRVFEANGRTGPATVTWCPGAPPPSGTFNPGCLGANTTANGGPTTWPGLLRYTKTSNQFGGPAPAAWPATATRGARLALNLAGLTAGDVPCSGAGCIVGFGYPGNGTSPPWGGAFGESFMGTNIAGPSSMGLYTASIGAAGTILAVGSPLTTPNGNPPLANPATTYPGPVTTGMVTHQVPGLVPPSTFVMTGSDQRDPVNGDGWISMVGGNMANRGTGASTNRMWVSMHLPEPGMLFALASGMVLLAGLNRRRGR